MAEELARLGARPWQIEITAPLLADAIVHPGKIPRAPSRRPAAEDGEPAQDD